MTVTGKTLGENIADAVNRDPEVIRPIDNPYSPTGGIAVLKGNLAPDGCVVKRSAVAPEMLVHEGPARVFDSEEETIAAIYAGQIKAGDVIVIRYEGPAGGPGMREMLSPTSAIAGMGLDKEVALITVLSFIFIMCFQLLNTNVSLIVAERGLGGVAESGMVTTATSFAGIFAGLLVGPLFKKFKNLAMPIAWIICGVGLVLVLVAPMLGMLAAGGFIASLGKETYVPTEGNFAAGNSAPEGRAFNLAIGMAGINFGMALSPVVFELLSTPFGHTIESKMIIGLVIVAVLVVFGFMHYNKLTPAQLAEMERMAAEEK
jgi:hypothetical protein